MTQCASKGRLARAFRWKPLTGCPSKPCGAAACAIEARKVTRDDGEVSARAVQQAMDQFMVAQKHHALHTQTVL